MTGQVGAVLRRAPGPAAGELLGWIAGDRPECHWVWRIVIFEKHIERSLA